MLALRLAETAHGTIFDERRRAPAASLHNRNRSLEGLKNPQVAGFFDAGRRSPTGVVNNSD
jgi:hypothetical protein